MILNDGEIEKRIDSGLIDIEPQITEKQIQPASLDVRLGHECYSETHGLQRGNDVIRVEPGDFLLGTTKERIQLPDDLAAQLTGRSSIGRRGIVVHATAGWIDPGFSGQITLEIFNMSSTAVSLGVGNRVAQLVFMPTIHPAQDPYDGQYQNQDGVQR